MPATLHWRASMNFYGALISESAEWVTQITPPGCRDMPNSAKEREFCPYRTRGT
jgi:hypothetical protein